MNSISSVTTGGFTVSAAALAPLVLWSFHGFPMAQMPDEAPLLVAAGVITGGHAIYNLINRIVDAHVAKVAARASAKP